MENKKNVLVVEDNHINALVVSKFVEKWGYDVKIVDSGVGAVESMEVNTSFDIIIMDLQMPIMDGFTATKILREKGFTVPIIALSADSLYLVSEKLEAAGFSDFVSKPLNPEILKLKIETLI